MADDPRIASCVDAHRPRLSSIQEFVFPLSLLLLRLIVCLLAEVGKGKSSGWYLYLSQLPTYYTILATFNDFEIEALQVDDAIWVAQKAVSAIRSEWEEAAPLMRELDFKPKLLMFKTWLWAFATPYFRYEILLIDEISEVSFVHLKVSSRTLHVAWDDAGCLCPIGDLFNYAAPDDDTSSEEQDTEEAMKCQERNVMLEEIKLDSSSERMTDGGYEDSNAYCLYARKRYRKGEQVLLGYGTYTNLELLEHYGFLLDENPNEKTYIQLDSELCTMGTWPKDSLYIHPNGHPSFALLCALRLGATPTNRQKSFSHKIYSGSMLSVENELEVMKRLGSKCVETLQQLPTTAELDGRLVHFLRNLQNSTNWRVDVEQSSFGQEFAAFLRFHSVDLDCTHNQLLVRLLRSLERWELAVRWRCSYKIALTKCVLYCKRLINELSLQ
ncbi:unnamed protein product [Triticum turgidum subsp. durum]|uniref:Rubisco LSMT substrate-binding domain-containing protein n=1 Tax=Triticum turgidum subsp. durum TaxID=4567 RepID=A0A9R1P473_TRITD|nr:unnamed protein product [Triticum turgidum subsp. durum]